MSSQWDNFRLNLGAWRGSFATYDHSLALKEERPSLLTLEGIHGDTMAMLALQRWEPDHEMRQVISSLGRQAVFFSSGSFGKGTMQVAPGVVFGAEYGFVYGDRRHRLVVLTDSAGRYTHPVLIREYRDGTAQNPLPPLTSDQLLGPWTGSEETMLAHSHELSSAPWSGVVEPSTLDGVRFLPDGGGFRCPDQISHREAFSVEAFWLSAEDRLEWLVRRYDGGGAWLSSHHRVLHR